MDEVIDRIRRIKEYLDVEDNDTTNKKVKKSKQQQKNTNNDTNNVSSRNKTTDKTSTPSKSKIRNKSKTPSKNKTPNKIQNKSQSVQSRKQKKYFETKSTSDFDEDSSSETDKISMAEIKEMQQRLQLHLVNLTKIINKNKSAKKVSQEINSNVKKRSPRPKEHQKHEEESIKIKKDLRNQSDNLSQQADDSIPVPIDFSNALSSSTNSTFLLHENDFPNYYRSNNSVFSLENFMNSNATHSILKNSKNYNDSNSNFNSKLDFKSSDLNLKPDSTSSYFNSKPDLKTSDLDSISSRLNETKKSKSSKKATFSSEGNRIPGEALLISSEKSINSDSYGVNFIPENYYGNNEINNQDDFLTFSISSNNEFNKDDNYQNVEIDDELKALYLDQNDNNTKTSNFSALESPIMKANDLEFGEYADININYDIGSDEGYQVSLDNY